MMDSLDRVELVMAIEGAVAGRDLAPAQRQGLLQSLEHMLQTGEFPDDAAAALVRKPGPNVPWLGGAAVSLPDNGEQSLGT